MLLSLFLLALATVPPSAPASSLLGDWVAPDKSIVRIYGCESNLCLKIVYVDPAVGHSTDGLNPDPSKRTQPLCSLVIGSGFEEKSSTKAEGGKLYDPESGKTYSGTLALEGANLKLHGYIGISMFGRTENWHRAQSGHPACS